LLSGSGALISAIVAAGTPIYAAVFIAAGLVLFLPAHVISHLGLDQVVKTYRMYVGLAFMLSGSLLLVRVSSFLWSLVSMPFQDWMLEKNGIKMIRETTDEEKAFLRAYVIDGKNTVYAQIQSGLAQGLEAKGIVFRSSTVGHLMSGFPYNLQPYMRRLLTKRPELLH
jgi:Super-infection exclusion protein B